jgi:hypothetical protein
LEFEPQEFHLKSKATQTPEISKAYSKEVKSEVIKLLKARLKSQESREALAETLGKSNSTISDLLFREKGSFDLIVAALMVVYRVDPASISKIIASLESSLTPPSEADRLWRELPIDDKTRLLYIAAIKMTLASKE